MGSVPALLLRVEPRRRRGRRHAWGKLHNPRPLAAKVEVFLSVHVHRAIGREILWQRVGVEVAGYTLGGGGADVAFLEKRCQRLSDPIRRLPGAQPLLARDAADNTVTHHFRHKELAVSVGLAGHQMNRE